VQYVARTTTPRHLQDLIRQHTTDVTNELVTVFRQEEKAIKDSPDITARVGVYEKIIGLFNAALKSLKLAQDLSG
jgi:hypothetical protein